MLGHKPQALTHLEFALSAHPNNSHYLAIAAGIHNQLGNRPMALTLLERAVGEGLTAKNIRMEVELENLRGEPRYDALLAGK